ncbi:MAG: DUF3189 family protein [Dethiobacter sp.]|jgi:hypothetical protein|nr:DUF3189 family protein [Dethiobacter sp.]MBS3902316.1 DUF3189 family protein [Dethiobacter sp.]MBS3989393.1 DUF3189 family protein [Dethiobacter sp.]
MAEKKIIYHCYGGAHSSVTAAAIHLGKLPRENTPTNDELLSLKLFDRLTKEGHGELHFAGVDEWQNQIYSVGCRNVGKAIERLLRGVADIFAQKEQLVFVDTLHCVTMKMRIGGYISRQLGLVEIGRPIVLQGTQEAYPQLVGLVSRIRNEVRR